MTDYIKRSTAINKTGILHTVLDNFHNVASSKEKRISETAAKKLNSIVGLSGSRRKHPQKFWYANE